MNAQERQERDQKIIELHNQGLKQKEIAEITGLGKSMVSLIICSWKDSLTPKEVEIFKYHNDIRQHAYQLRVGDRVHVTLNDREFEATIEQKCRYTVLCKDDMGFRCCPRYQDVKAI